jgi:Ca-activated chloride channel homolog
VERARPPLSLVLAIDVSGSMKGPPIDHVIQSIDRLLGLLDPTDRVGVVAFSDGASEIAPLAAMEADARRLISTRVHRLVADGATHMESGLRRAAGMMPPRGPHERQVVVLLSDGAPNRGLSAIGDLAALARSFRPDVAVSTLGYGAHHNEDVLRKIADAGAGRYHFIADPIVCQLELAQAIGAQGDVVAEAIELSIAPEERVEITRFLGNPEVRFGSAAVRVAVPDLLDGASHLAVAELEIDPPRAPGPMVVLRAHVAYRRAGERETRSIERSLSIPVVQGRRAVVPAARAQVLRVKSDEVRAEARSLADRGQFEGAGAVLRKAIQAIQAEPWFQANDGSPLAEVVEQLVDEAGALERKPNVEDYRAFRKTQISMVMSTETPPASQSAPMSVRLTSSVAGPLPKAALVVVSGAEAARYPLDQPRLVIGRTPSAQIRVNDVNVSRQHASVMAQNGVFYIVDMGSTNCTLVNQHQVRKPHALSHGDLIQVGDVVLRYVEEGRAQAPS